MATDSRLKSFEKKMEDSIVSLNKDLSTIRTGRAHSSMLDLVKVEVYGQSIPINQVGTIRLTTQAVLEKSKSIAFQALLADPVVDDYNSAKSLLDTMLYFQKDHLGYLK